MIDTGFQWAHNYMSLCQGDIEMIATPKTDTDLIMRMQESAKRLPTKKELERQRISYVYGNLPKKSAITRDRVAEKIKMNEGV